MAALPERLARAKTFLVIAESKDSKREAYKRATKEIVAYKQETGDTFTEIAVKLGRVVLVHDREQRKNGSWYVSTLVKWHDSGFKDETPFLRGGGTRQTAALADLKRGLREQPMEVIEQIVSTLPPERVAKVARATLTKPGLAREMAKDPEASASVVRLSGQVAEERAERNKQRSRKTRTAFTGPIETLSFLSEVLGALMKAKRCLSEAYTAAREHDLSDDHREALIEQLDELQTVSDWFRSFVESGDQSFEDELEKLLAD